MSRIALGTVQFGLEYGIANRAGKPSDETVRAILAAARAGGVDTLDTAIAYGDSESRLGAIGTRDFRAVTKLPGIPDGCANVRAWVRDEVQRSLARLGRDRLDGLLLHRPMDLLSAQGEELWKALQSVRDEGFAGGIGVSVYEPRELDLLAKFPFDIVQAPFSVVDRRMLESGWLSRLADQETEVHARSVFLQGLLLMRAGERPAKFNRWADLWTRWDRWVSDAGLTPLGASLQYALSFDSIARIVVGVESPEQLREILAAAVGPSSETPWPAWGEIDQDLLNPSRWNSL